MSQLFALGTFSVSIADDHARLEISCKGDFGSMMVPIPTTELVTLGARSTSLESPRYKIPSGLTPIGLAHWVEVIFTQGDPWLVGPFSGPDAARLALAFDEWRAAHPIDREPVDVTEEQLLSDPARWHLRRIRVTGTWSAAFEASRFADRVWLQVDYVPAAGTYRVRVVGTWIYPDASADGGYGHFGLYPGELRPESMEILEAPPNRPIDGLTGLSTRATFDIDLAKARATGAPLVFAMLDIDGLKRINDEHGHLYGDDVIRRYAKTVASVTRPVDLVTRWAGDELGILFSGATVGESVAMLNSALRSLSEGKHACTFSAGVVEVGRDESSSHFVARAQRLAIDAKRAGRNRIAVG